MTPFIGICFCGGPVSAASYTELWHKSGEPLFQSSPQINIFVIAVYSHLSLDDVPQRFVQCGNIRTWYVLARMMMCEVLVSYSQSCGLEYVQAVTHSCGEVCVRSTVLQPHSF